MSDPNDQNTETVPSVSGDSNKPQKSSEEGILGAKDKYDKGKEIWNKIKGIKALAPLVTIISVLGMVLLIVFLVIGFVAFFITMPGLFVNRAVEMCRNFWDNIVLGKENIEIKSEDIVDFAQYIEDLGYDLEGYGFATKSSIEREEIDDDSRVTGKRGKITNINLDPDEDTNSSYIGMINMLNYAQNNSIDLGKNSDLSLIYPIEVLRNVNIVSASKDDQINYYKAENKVGTGTTIQFYDDNGNEIKYNITTDEDGTPYFEKNNNGKYTYSSLKNGVTINGYNYKVIGLSYDDNKRLYKKGKYDKMNTDNQEAYIDQYISFLSQYDLSVDLSNDSGLWDTIAALHNVIGISTGGSVKETAAAALFVTGNNVGEYIISNNMEDFFSDDDGNNVIKLINAIKTGSNDLSKISTKMVEKAAFKNQNLYAYILANERTYTAQGVNQNLTQRFVTLPILKELAALDDSERFSKIFDPAHFGMIVFPANAFGGASPTKGDFGVSIDRNDNSMIITTQSGFLGLTTNQTKWNLSGWTSRYGKPIELSLALHLSTMAPDFVYDFCMDKELQTKVTMGTKEITYDLVFSFVTSNGKTVYWDKDTNGEEPKDTISIKETYEAAKDKLVETKSLKYLFKKGRYIGESARNIESSDKDVPQMYDWDTATTDDYNCYPLDIFNTTNIISVVPQGLNAKVKYYKAVCKDSNGNETPLELFKQENGTIKINGYFLHMDENGPYFSTENNGDEYAIQKFIYNNNKPQRLNNAIVIDNQIVTLQVLSIKDLGYFTQVLWEQKFVDNEGNKLDDTTRKKLFDQLVTNGNFTRDLGGGNSSTEFYKFMILNQNNMYQKTLERLDLVINEIIGNEDYTQKCKDRAIDFELQLYNLKFDNGSLIQDGTNYTFKSTEGKKGDFKLKTKVCWTNMINYYKKNDPSDFAKKNIDTFKYWIYDYLAKQIIGESEIDTIKQDKHMRAKMYILLTDDLWEKLQTYGMTCEELFTLYDILSEQPSSVKTYQPYIESVTNHWYKDLKFEMGKTYKETSNMKTVTYDFKPEGEAADDRIETLHGTIKCSMKPQEGSKGVVQIGEPEIIKNETWHYKVKNWLVYGYYFIYDGSIQTAEEIDKAKLLLVTNGYDPENPLLIDVSGDDLKNLYTKGTKASDIDKKAEEYNAMLEKAEINVRLKKINFEKKSSLAAFSILESVHTEDSEYIYRDLKEYLIELGYFTRADFESIETGVLKWIIPSYTVYKDEWPDIEYEKNSLEYGNYIRSKESITMQRSEAYKSSVSSMVDDSPTALDDKTSYVGHMGDKGYDTTTNIDGIIYKNYKQGGSAPYSGKPFNGRDMAFAGCGPTSAAIMLSGYGNENGPYELAEWITHNAEVTDDGTEGSYVISKLLNSQGLNVERGNVNSSNDVNSSADKIIKALQAKKPVMLGCQAGGHWVCAIGITSDGKSMYISNPSGGSVPDVKNIMDFVNDMVNGECAYIIPEKAPTGVTSNKKNHEVVGFKKGLKVVMPENGVIEKVGSSEENNKATTNENTTENTNGSTTENPEGSATSNPDDTPDDDPDEEKPTYDERVDKANGYFTTNGKYVIIKLKTGNGVNNWKIKIEGFDIDEGITEGIELNKGDTLGKTTSDNMKVVLYDDKGAIMDNAEDYFKLPKRNETSGSDWAKLYYIVYEGVKDGTDTWGYGPECVGKVINKNEMGVGINQWTVIIGKNWNNVTKLIKKLIEKDSSFFASLQPFTSLSNPECIEKRDDIKTAFEEIAEIDKEYFLKIQMEIAVEELTEKVQNSKYPWILDRPDAVIGSYFAILNHGFDADPKLDEGMSDEEIIKRLCCIGATSNTTAGSVKTRYTSQARAGIDILNGKLDAENFVRKGVVGYPQYANGENMSYLDEYIGEY